MFNVYGVSCTCASEPSLPCPSTWRSGRSCSTVTALHVHMLRSHGRFANRLAQVVTAVPRLRRVMCTLFGAVVALPIDVFKCSYSFNAYGDVMSIRFKAIEARSIHLLKCSELLRMRRYHLYILGCPRRHGHRLAQVVEDVQRVRRVMCTCFGAIASMSIDLPKWSQLFSVYDGSCTHSWCHRRHVHRLAQVVAFDQRLHLGLNHSPRIRSGISPFGAQANHLECLRKLTFGAQANHLGRTAGVHLRSSGQSPRSAAGVHLRGSGQSLRHARLHQGVRQHFLPH